MPLSPGTRLGRYDVTSLLGEGGMGQVWQATDTQLNRQVALKILPDAFAADPDRLARFTREAQILASLNHPNIAAIYGLEEGEGTRALVLELVEGPTLADRIGQGAIPVEDALPIARQIAEALEAAHEAGVIHRDLKPANIKVREDGTVKVLDIGLAKALDPAPADDPSQSPTLTAAATQMGVILGTAAYMSPEQARGKSIDKRTDVWAYGAVVFEMLTGRRAFPGEDLTDTIAAVVRGTPAWDSLPQGVPSRVMHVLRACLEKDRAQRVRDVGDVTLALEGTFEAPAAPSQTSAPAAAGLRGALPWVAGILLAVVTGLAVWSVTRPDAPRAVHFAVSPDDGRAMQVMQFGPDVAISPNGQHVAYLSGGSPNGAQRLHVRSFDRFTSTTLVADGVLGGPFFSPDGAWVGFYDILPRYAIRRVPVQGGPTTVIYDLPDTIYGASWGADDSIVFSSGGDLWRVAATSGEPEQLTIRDAAQGGGTFRWREILASPDIKVGQS